MCPRIEVIEENGSDSIVLNNYVNNGLASMIIEMEVPDPYFALTGRVCGDQNFLVRVFKFYNPGSRKSKISLVAHKREVEDTAIDNYIPEFTEEFYDKADGDNDTISRNYIIKGYVFGEYLDKHVSFERGGFNFRKDGDLLPGDFSN